MAARRGTRSPVIRFLIAPKIGASFSVGMQIKARASLKEFVGGRAGHKDQVELKAAVDAWFSEVAKAE